MRALLANRLLSTTSDSTLQMSATLYKLFYWDDKHAVE